MSRLHFVGVGVTASRLPGARLLDGTQFVMLLCSENDASISGFDPCSTSRLSDTQAPARCAVEAMVP